MAKRNACAFCPATSDITGEHIWDDWFCKALGKGKYYHVRKEIDGVVKQWEQHRLNWKTKVVCGKCNHGWMSNVVNLFKGVAEEMIFDRCKKNLTEKEMATFAAFAFLKCVVADHSHENRESFFTIPERYSFRKTLTIPEGVQMWFANFPHRHGLFKSMYAESPGNTRNDFEINSFTYGIGYLVLQVCAFRWKKRRAHKLHPRLGQISEWRNFSTEFWPYPIFQPVWPTTSNLSGQVLDKFCTRWNSLNKNW
jgi:hypothetical protein